MAAAEDSTGEEQRLVERFRSGDRGAFGDLVQRHQRGVYFLVWRHVRHEEDARDITQAAFVRAWNNAGAFRGDSSFRTWIYRIASNLALNWLRDRGRWKLDELSDQLVSDAVDAPELLDQALAADQLRVAIAALPSKQRLVVDLRVQEGLSFREVAEIADCSEDAAKANFHHGLKRLRGLLVHLARPEDGAAPAPGPAAPRATPADLPAPLDPPPGRPR
jgi:RNA polymerase sigma-70 factor (ECF subfamily)